MCFFYVNGYLYIYLVNTGRNLGFPGSSDGKESACNAGDPGSVPGLGKAPGEGNGNPLRSSSLENSMDRPWSHKDSDTTEWLTLDSRRNLQWRLLRCQKYDLFSFLFCPSGGDQPENYLGQDSSDDNHSGTHGPSFTSDAPFLSDYPDEGECHLSVFRMTVLLYFLSWGLCLWSFSVQQPSEGSLYW